MRINKKLLISGIIICTIAGLVAIDQNSYKNSKNITTGVVLATATGNAENNVTFVNTYKEELTTEGTTASTTENTTASTTENTTASTTENTTASTTESTTASTTESTTASRTESTTASTTENTTASTTENTTESTTASTTESTTASTTESTTKSTTESTKESTTEKISNTKKPVEKAPEIVEAEQEVDLEEARQNYKTVQLNAEDGFYIYQVQAAKPYYRVFFSYNDEKLSEDLFLDSSNDPIDGVHGTNNIFYDSKIQIDKLDYKKSDIPRNYILILDVSENVEEEVFNKAKEDIKNFIRGLTDDSVTLYINSDSKKEADYKFIYKDGGEKLDDSVLKDIMNIEQESDSVELESVYQQILADRLDYNQTYKNDNPPKYIQIPIVITDKEDSESGALFYDNDNILQGEIFVDISNAVKDSLDDIQSSVNDIYVVYLKGTTNKSDEKAQDLILYLYDDENEIRYEFEPYEIQISEKVEDNVAPTLERAQYYQEDNQDQIWIWYSEPVVNADDEAHYQLINLETEEGKNIEPINVDTVQAKNTLGTIYMLTLPEAVVPGEYEIKIIGTTDKGIITDKSEEQNAYEDPIEPITVEIPKKEESDSGEETKKTLDKKLISILSASIGLILIVASSIIIVVRKKRNKQKVLPPVTETQERKGGVAYNGSSIGEPITLILKKEEKTIKELHAKVNGSLIVGRADTSDVEVDEPGMSRQHFVIEYDGDSFYIQDLDTTNGTKLNGVKINHKRRLEKNDHIKIAGLDIIVRW